jgi:hypothetical protein
MRPAHTVLSFLLALVAVVGCGEGGDSESGEGATTTRGGVGDTLLTADDYEQDGRPVEERLRLTLEDVELRAKPEDPLAGIKKKGYRWAKVRVRLRQTGSTPASVLVTQFALLDSEGQRYPAEEAAAGIAEPELAPDSNAVDLEPEEARSGFLVFQVPDDAKITALSFKDLGYGPAPDSARWVLRSKSRS